MEIDKKAELAKRIVTSALKKAKTINLSKASIAVFNEHGNLLHIGCYEKDQKKSESDCRMKLNALLDKKMLTEIGGIRDVIFKLLGKLIGKDSGVQGVVKVTGLGYVTAMCVFDSRKDVQVIHETLTGLGFIVEDGETIWAADKMFVYTEPGWVTYCQG